MFRFCEALICCDQRNYKHCAANAASSVLNFQAVAVTMTAFNPNNSEKSFV